MNKIYQTPDEFKKDLTKTYQFADVAEIMGWLDKEEIEHGKIRCPFHKQGKEHTPSCQIGDHFFRCYGCGEKGDIFTFGMKKEGISYYECINMIATALGCKIDNLKAISESAKLMKEYKAEWIKRVDALNKILENPSSHKYSKEIIERYNKLYPMEVGYNEKDNRISIPFTGPNGEILGFTDRVVLPDQTPKWKHSNVNNSLTRLCTNLCGVQNIKGYDRCYIVEGPGDIAGMLRAGFPNTIAVCGCEHVNKDVLAYLISLGIKSITVVFDGDKAGQDGNINFVKVGLIHEYFLLKDSKIAILKDDKDPGEFTSDELCKFITDAVDARSFLFDSIDMFEMKELYNTSTKVVKDDIINFIMTKYECKKYEAYKILGTKNTSTKDDITLLKDVSENIGTKEDVRMSQEKANALLYRKYGIKK